MRSAYFYKDEKTNMLIQIETSPEAYFAATATFYKMSLIVLYFPYSGNVVIS